MHPRTIVLILSCVCGFIAMAVGFGWSILDLDDGWIRQDAFGWSAAAVFFLALSALPLWDWLYERYHR